MPAISDARWRNIILYVTGVMILSLIGGWLMVNGQDVGGLIFVMGPLLMATILRLFGGDGWRTAGLKLNLRGNGAFYALSVLVFPVAFAFAMICGIVFGAVELQEGFATGFAAAAAIGLIQWTVFALFEEFGWRGYLDPQLAELGVRNGRRHIFVAVVWGVWHVPFIYASANYSGLPVPVFALMFALSILAMTVWYGVVRARTNSVWPAVIAHGLANALAWPLLDPELVVVSNVMVFAARPDSVVVLLTITAVAVFLWFRVQKADA